MRPSDMGMMLSGFGLILSGFGRVWMSGFVPGTDAVADRRYGLLALALGVLQQALALVLQMIQPVL